MTSLDPPAFHCPTFEESYHATGLLWPRGRAWPVMDGTVRGNFLGWLAGLVATPKPTDWPAGFVQSGYNAAIAALRNYFEQQMCALRLEFWCQTQSETTAQWMIEYGLPDPCDPFPDLCAKVAAIGGTRCEYYAEIAARAGWTIDCVTEFNDCGAVMGCAQIGDAGLGGQTGQATIVIDVDLDNSPSYVAPLENAQPYMGNFEIGQSLACAPDITALQCILERVVHAHIAIDYNPFSRGDAMTIEGMHLAEATDAVYLPSDGDGEALALAATTDAGLAGVGSVSEAMTLASSQNGTINTATASVSESGSMADSPDGTLPFNGAVWDSGTVASVTLSGGNLVATNTGTTGTNQGAHVASGSGKSSGKYYFECTITTSSGSGVNDGFGVGTTASTFSNMGNSATAGDVAYRSGNIWHNGGNSGQSAGTTWTSGVVIGCAVDLDNREIWFKKVSSIAGNWNNSGANDPATNVGGVSIPAGTMVPFVVFGGAGGNSGNVVTANFGASAFVGTVPSGFTAGWPA